MLAWTNHLNLYALTEHTFHQMREGIGNAVYFWGEGFGYYAYPLCSHEVITISLFMPLLWFFFVTVMLRLCDSLMNK